MFINNLLILIFLPTSVNFCIFLMISHILMLNTNSSAYLIHVDYLYEY
jgi:hypothetical protein